MSVTRIWQLQTAEDGGLYAGVEPAGLFRSEDRGESWASDDALNYNSGREKWEPGGGGLCLHTILPYPGDSRRMLAGISAEGIFATYDAGSSWRMYEAGIRYYDEEKLCEKHELATSARRMVLDAKDP